MFKRLVRWLERRLVADEEDSRYYDWADRMLDLREEFKERAKRHWRDGGPGSTAYEAWLRDWETRAHELSVERTMMLWQAHPMPETLDREALERRLAGRGYTLVSPPDPLTVIPEEDDPR